MIKIIHNSFIVNLVTVIMNYFLIAFVFQAALAGKVCIPKHWTFEWWQFEEGFIQFTLYLYQETYDNYGWVGIGFQYPDDGAGMTNSDLVNIFLGSTPEDFYSAYSGMPRADVELGGNSNLKDIIYDEHSLVYSWKRPIDSHDFKFDKVYQKDSNMTLLWACGTVTEGHQDKHAKEDHGKIDITLSYEFLHDCLQNEFLQLN